MEKKNWKIIIYSYEPDCDYDDIYEKNRKILKEVQVPSYDNALEMAMGRKFQTELLDQIKKNDPIHTIVSWNIINLDNKIINNGVIDIIKILQFERNYDVSYKDIGKYLEDKIYLFYQCIDDDSMYKFGELLKELVRIKPFYKIKDSTKYYLSSIDSTWLK